MEPDFYVSFSVKLIIDHVPMTLQNYSLDSYGVNTRPYLGILGAADYLLELIFHVSFTIFSFLVYVATFTRNFILDTYGVI